MSFTSWVRLDATRFKERLTQPGADRQSTRVRLNKSLSQTLSKDDFWFDPYVGLRTRYNFNKTYYTAVRGEIRGIRSWR